MISQNFHQQNHEATVKIDDYISDLNLEIGHDGYSCQPMHKDGFAYMWAGAKATYGVRRGKVCYEVKILENLEVSTSEFTDAHIVRVGWSTDATTLQLGEDKNSFGYGGTAKKSEARKFSDYGRRFDTGDVVSCYLSITSGWADISYCVNGYQCGTAFKVRWDTDEALYPHILTKNCKVEVNFGQARNPYFSLLPGYRLIGSLPVDLRVPAVRGPATKQDCEVIMMVGLPGVGKTTWAMNYAKLHPNKKYNILGTDAIIDKMRVQGLPRKDNFGGRWDVLIKQASECFNIMLRKASTCRRNLILDQTNVYASARKRKVRQYKDAGYTVNAMVLVPTDDDMISRSTQRTLKEGKEVPEAAVYDMKANFSLPHEDEKMFSKITFLELQREDAENLVEQYNVDASLKGYKSNKQTGHGPNENQKEISERRQSSGIGKVSKDIFIYDRPSYSAPSTETNKGSEVPRDFLARTDRSLRVPCPEDSCFRNGSYENEVGRRRENVRDGNDRFRSNSRNRDKRPPNANNSSGVRGDYRDRGDRRADDMHPEPISRHDIHPLDDMRSRASGRSDSNELRREGSVSRDRRPGRDGLHAENANMRNDARAYASNRDNYRRPEGDQFQDRDGIPRQQMHDYHGEEVRTQDQSKIRNVRPKPGMMHPDDPIRWNKQQSADFYCPPAKHQKQNSPSLGFEDLRDNFRHQDNFRRGDSFGCHDDLQDLGSGMSYGAKPEDQHSGHFDMENDMVQRNWGRYPPENQRVDGPENPTRRPRSAEWGDHNMESVPQCPVTGSRGPPTHDFRNSSLGQEKGIEYKDWHGEYAPSCHWDADHQRPPPRVLQYVESWNRGEEKSAGFEENTVNCNNLHHDQFQDASNQHFPEYGSHSIGRKFNDIQTEMDKPSFEMDMARNQGEFFGEYGDIKHGLNKVLGPDKEWTIPMQRSAEQRNWQPPFQDRSIYEALSPKLTDADFENLKATLANVQQARQEEIQPLLAGVRGFPDQPDFCFAKPGVYGNRPVILTEKDHNVHAPSYIQTGPGRDDKDSIRKQDLTHDQCEIAIPSHFTPPKRNNEDKKEGTHGHDKLTLQDSRSERVYRHSRRDNDRKREENNRGGKSHGSRSRSHEKRSREGRERSPRDSHSKSGDRRRRERSSYHKHDERPSSKDRRKSSPHDRRPLLETPISEKSHERRDSSRPRRFRDQSDRSSGRVACSEPAVKGYDPSGTEPLPLQSDDWNQLEAVEVLIKDHLQPKLRNEAQQKVHPEERNASLLGDSHRTSFGANLFQEFTAPEAHHGLESFPVRRPPLLDTPELRPRLATPPIRLTRAGQPQSAPNRFWNVASRLGPERVLRGPPVRSLNQSTRLVDITGGNLMDIPPGGMWPQGPRPRSAPLREPPMRGTNRSPVIRIRPVEQLGQDMRLRGMRPRGPWDMGHWPIRPRGMRPFIRR